MTVDLIDEERYDRIMQDTVLPDLALCRHEGWMTSQSASGKGGILVGEADRDRYGSDELLHYVCYDRGEFQDRTSEPCQARCRGAVVISFGFTEFADKYQELTWYFLMEGYSVCILEHWGHGFSGRGVSDPNLVWVDHWQRYVADLAAFCSQVGRSYAGDRPLVLYAHSMGGGVGARLLERFPVMIDKAILSSPMIVPRTGLMPAVAWSAANGACLMGWSRRMAPGFGPFNPEINMDNYPGGSRARVTWAQRQRRDQVRFQTSAATFGWVRESLELSRAVLRPSQCGQVESPLLVFQAQHDRFVLPSPQERFVAQVRDGGCQAELVKIPDSMHELYQMPNAVLGPYLDRIFAFLDEPCQLDEED